MTRLLDPPHRYFGIYLCAIVGAQALFLSGWACLYGALLGTLCWLGIRLEGRGPWPRLAAMCAFLAVSMNVSYEAMGKAVPLLRSTRYDSALLSLDRLLLGETPALMLQPFITPARTEILSGCYFFFLPLLFFSLVRYFIRQRELLGEFYAGLFTVYGIGFLGYLLLPAAGPWKAHAQLFQVPFQGGVLTALNEGVVRHGSNGVDVWPSLHCAVSCYILCFAWRHHRREFWLTLLPVAGLWLSTMYLRYHYFTDVASGFALAAFGLYESCRYRAAATKEI